jgi:outer membrane protein assembly factor BamB
MRPLACLFAGMLLLPTLHSTMGASTWTQYRGSNNDGVAAEAIRTNWNETLPTVLWKKTLPFGLSSFSVGDNARLYTMGRRPTTGSESEFCLALDANTGAELWATPIGAADYPDGGVGSDDGPRSTPTIDGDRVIAFGSYLNLVCLNATNGLRIWSHNLISEFGAQVIRWQNAASPTVVGDLVIVSISVPSNDRLIAFNKTSGALVWNRPSFGMTHATPVRATIGGMEQVVVFGQRAVFAVELLKGNVLWQFAVAYNGTSVAASPVVAEDTVYISRAYPNNAGAIVLQITNLNGSFNATRKWEQRNALMNHWATPVYYNGHYYGMFGQDSLQFRCVDAADGTTRWQTTGFSYGSVTRAGDKIIALSADGQIALVEASPEQYVEIARFRPLRTKTWNNPAVSGGRIYVRSTSEAVALDVSVPSSTPAVPLKLGIARFAPGQLTLEVATEDGTPIDAARAGSISLFSNTDFRAPAPWTRITNSTVLANGKLTLETDRSQPKRFFRTEEPR